jgi:hypothetical protein
MNTTLYVIYDKTDRNAALNWVAICTTYQRADELVQQLRDQVPEYCHKFIWWEELEADEFRPRVNVG